MEITNLIQELHSACEQAGKHAHTLTILFADGRELLVLRDLLTLSSPVLKELFDNDTYDDTEQLPFGDSFSTLNILRFLYMLYPTLSKEVFYLQSSWVDGIMPIAHKYDVLSIIKKCVVWADLTVKIYKEVPSISDTLFRLIRSRPTETTEDIKLLCKMDHFLNAFEDIIDWAESSIINFAMCIQFDDIFMELRKKTQLRILTKFNTDRDLVIDAFNHSNDRSENMIILEPGQMCVRTDTKSILWGNDAMIWWQNDHI